MSKEKEQLKNKINQYLDVYSLDQLQFLKKIITTYSSTYIDKNSVMQLVYSEEELRKVDSALPNNYVEDIKNILPSFNTFHNVYDYNENTFGEMKNISESLSKKLHTVLNNSHFK